MKNRNLDIYIYIFLKDEVGPNSVEYFNWEGKRWSSYQIQQFYIVLEQIKSKSKGIAIGVWLTSK